MRRLGLRQETQGLRLRLRSARFGKQGIGGRRDHPHRLLEFGALGLHQQGEAILGGPEGPLEPGWGVPVTVMFSARCSAASRRLSTAGWL